MKPVRIYTGPAFSSRTRVIHDAFQQNPSETILVVPTQRGARFRQSEIIDQFQLPGLLGERVTTYEGLVRQLVRGTRFEASLIDGVQQRLVLERCIHDTVESDRSFDALAELLSTRGFVSHLQHALHQIKQCAITPDDLDGIYARKESLSTMDRAIASIYRGYQQQLVENEFYDLPGMFWMADVSCIESLPAFFQRTRNLIFDGFDDYTPSEFRLLESMAGHLDQLTFGLAMDQDDNRRDAYALVHMTLDKIKRSFPNHRVVQCESEAPVQTTEYVFRNLFWNDEPKEVSSLDGNLRLIQCHSFTHELESVARRVRRLITDSGVSPSQIAVVARGLDQQSIAVRETFRSYGVPIRFYTGFRLSTDTFVQSISNILRAIGSWERMAVLDVVMNPGIGPWDDSALEHRHAFPTLVRCMQVRHGRTDWIRGLDQVESEIEEATFSPFTELRHFMPEHTSSIAALRQRLDWLLGVDDDCPTRGTVGEYVAFLNRTFLTSEHIDEYLERKGGGLAAGLSTLRALLSALSEFATARDSIGRGEWAALWEDATQSATLPPDSPPGSVLVIDPENARHLKFDHVFWMGVQEGVYPNPTMSNAVIPEAERSRLRRLGLPFDPDESIVLRERMLFLRMFSTARVELVMSWHTRLSNGQEGRPSAFLAELRELPIPFPLEKPTTVLDTLVPELDFVRNGRDALNYLGVHNGELDKLNVSGIAGLKSGIAGEEYRQSDSYNAFDGQLLDTANVNVVAEQFGDAHVFSANQLETWLTCPFRFFVERVLALPDWPDADNELDPRLRGLVYHDVLESFYRGYSGKTHGELDPVEAGERLTEIIEKQFDEHLWKQRGLSKGILKIESERIRVALHSHVERMIAAGDIIWRPEHFEVSFGDTRSGSNDDWQKDAPYEVKSSIGRLRFSGRIDRIDVGDDNHLRIVDYKSNGQAMAPAVRDEKAIQLKLYACATEDWIAPGTRCVDGRYVGIMRFGELETLKLGGPKSISWDEQKRALWERIEATVQHIRMGTFHPTQEKEPCVGCPNGRICRFDRVRLERKLA